MSVEVIKKLAVAFGPDLPGIPWYEIEQQTGATAAELVFDTELTTDAQTPSGTSRYLKVMDDAFRRAEKIVKSIDLPWDMDTKSASDAWKEVKDETLSVGDAALAAFSQDFYAILPVEDGLQVSIDKVRAIVASIYITAISGYLLQLYFVMQKLDRRPEDIIEHIEEITQAFNLITYLEEGGFLDALKKNVPVKATGAVQVPVVVGVVIAITSAAAIAALAWSMVAMRKISATNKTMEELCRKATDTQDADLIEACVELSKQNQVALENGPSFGMDSIAKYALLGVGAYLLVMMGPSLVRAYSMKQKPMGTT